MTADWGGGYVTDIEYTTGYFPSQSPQMLALACLINGIAVDPPWEAEHLHYLELGCGRGVNACVVAAANPGWQVTGIDFMPGAIADARRLATEAGLDNITFLEADLSVFAESAEAAALPMADIATAHGVWSWVGDPVRAGIVRLLATRLRAGGIFHVSYNALPAQQALLAIQRMLREAGRRLAGRSDRQAGAGRDVVKALAEAGAHHFASTAIARDLIARLDDMPVPYLAHEYMNEHWRPCYHADVATALSAARLDYAGSARLVDNFVELVLTPEQRAIHDRFDDPLMRELVIDTCINRTLRHDVLVRGARRLANADRDAILARARIVLAVDPESFHYALKMPAGEATVGEGYRARVAALAEGPRTLAELAPLGGTRANFGEMAMVLVGTQQAHVVRDTTAGPSPRQHRFNAALARRDVRLDNLNAPTVLACLRAGTGQPSRTAEALLVAHIGAAGAMPDPMILAADLLPGEGQTQREELASLLARVVRERLAVWQRLGFV